MRYSRAVIFYKLSDALQEQMEAQLSCNAATLFLFQRQGLQ
jgi:hypothetical protein